jgi:hypothetical protein
VETSGGAGSGQASRCGGGGAASSSVGGLSPVVATVVVRGSDGAQR